MQEQATPTLLEEVPEIKQVMTITSIVGEGTFSTVYKGCMLPHLNNSDTPRYFAVKHLTPLVDPTMQYNELNYLTKLGGQFNIISVLFATRHHDSLAIVMPYFEHDKFSRLVKKMECQDVQDYMKNLLLALKYMHSHRIIHRDIKPNNFLYSLRSRQCALVDFGLAQDETAPPSECEAEPMEEIAVLHDITATVNHMESGNVIQQCLDDNAASSSSNSNRLLGDLREGCDCTGQSKICRGCIAAPGVEAARAGTAGYRPPEVLLKYSKQTTAVDMWACGVIFLSLLSGRANFFNAPDDIGSLAQMITLFGKDALITAAKSMNKNLIADMGCGNSEPVSLKKICTDLRTASKLKTLKCKLSNDIVLFPHSAYDLLQKLLILDPKNRITAAEALEHPFITSQYNL